MALGIRKSVLEQLAFPKSEFVTFAKSDILDLAKSNYLDPAKFFDFPAFDKFSYLPLIPPALPAIPSPLTI